MRLTKTEIAVIKDQANIYFGPNTEVWLFGSRVNNDERGGDIDLYINLVTETDDLMNKSLQYNAALQGILGEQKIDVVTHKKDQEMRSIDKEVLRNGIKL